MIYLYFLPVVLYLKKVNELDKGISSGSRGLAGSGSSYNRLFKLIAKQVLLEIR